MAHHQAVRSDVPRPLAEVLEDARSRIERLEPAAAYAAARAGALIVDTRSELDRELGIVPGSLHIPRTVLEWRVDPDSPWRNPHVGGFDRQIIVLCDHGYSSSFSAAVLVELGFTRAGEVVGGFEAWRQAGLPVTRPGPVREPGVLAGMGSPER